jgi:CelD/BcsL family acetyltransferase involved in cellulose biosynthesis
VSDKFDEQARELVPCLCHDDYKRRSRIDPTCPGCDYHDDIAAALRAAASAPRTQAFEEAARIVEKSYLLLSAKEFDAQTATQARRLCAELIRARGGDE